jgi:hypothetical protein
MKMLKIRHIALRKHIFMKHPPKIKRKLPPDKSPKNAPKYNTRCFNKIFTNEGNIGALVQHLASKGPSILSFLLKISYTIFNCSSSGLGFPSPSVYDSLNRSINPVREKIGLYKKEVCVFP